MATKQAGNAAALHYALQFAVRGIPVFPCNVLKEPILRGDWRVNATTDADMITAWSRRSACTAFGMPTGQQSGRAVADIDPRHGGTREGHGLTTTEMVKTPSGGWHCHYSCKRAVKSNPKFAPGVEIKGDGNYVILPGGRCHSKNADGSLGPVGTYRRTGRASPIAVLPPHLAARPDRSAADGRAGGSDGVSEPSRHKTMLDYGVSLGHRGLNDGEMVALLTRYDNDRNDPPKNDPKEIRGIVAWVREHVNADEAEIDKLARDIRNRAEAHRRVAADSAAVSFELPPIGWTVADDLRDPPPPTRYRIAELHPQDTNSLFIAAYTTGKSTTVINLAKSLADGVPFLGRFAVDFPEGRIGYWNYEMPKTLSNGWIDDVDIENKDRIVKLDLRGQRMPLNGPGVKDRLVDWLQGNEVKFLIIDVLAKASAGFVTDENDNSQAIAYTDALDEMLMGAGVSDLVVTTHMGRYRGPDGTETSRGATRYQDWARRLVVLEEGQERRPQHVGRRP